MTDKELIKQEIKRRIDLYSIAEKDDTVFSCMGALSGIIDFIDSLPEESASEDLEEEIERWIKEKHFVFTEIDEIIETARYFAEWQKQKDQETIELAEDHAMLAGMNKMKEEMMENAADSKITTDGNSIFPIIKYQLPLTYDCKIGDKVKLIIIKEE